MAELPAVWASRSFRDRLSERWAAAFGGVTSLEWWGYLVWGVVGAMIAIPELGAAIWSHGPWPTISGTIGHLEVIWSATGIFVVGIIVAAAYHIVRYRPAKTEAVALRSGGRALRRTQSGRLTRRPPAAGVAADPVKKAWIGIVYLVSAFLAVLLPSILAATAFSGSSDHTRWILGYVIYGLIALFCVALPSALAYFVADVPFPTLFRTISDLERLWRPLAVVVLAGLGILVVHLALYPWPDIAHILQQTPTKPTSP
jgi:hypothetical protein